MRAELRDDAGTFRVAAYNLYLGADLGLVLGDRSDAQLESNVDEVVRQLQATAFPLRVEALAQVIARHRVDLLGLQEVCTWSLDGVPVWDYQRDLLAALERAGEPYDLVVAQPTFTGAGEIPHPEAVATGRAAKARLRLEGSDVVLRRRRSGLAVREVASGTFAVAYTQPALGGEITITRGWCRARVELPDETVVDFVTTHTEAHDPTSRDLQQQELLSLADALRGPLVLVGDFNSTPDQIGMPPELADAWVAAGHDELGSEGATSGQTPDLSDPHSRLRERIDYVWVRGLRVRGAWRIGADPDDRAPSGLWPSDHAGVVAELSATPAHA